jgi:replicative DNA helicase
MAFPPDERSTGALDSPPPADSGAYPPPPDEKGPPFDYAAESALLGSCLIDLNAYMEVSAFIRRDDFYLHSHRVLWDSISAIYERGDSIDELTIESELRAQHTLNDVGGMPYVIQLLTTTPTSANAETYGRLVERGAIRRALIDAASRIAQAAQEETADIHEVMSKAEATLFGVTERSLTRRELVPMSSAISEYYDQIAEQYKHRGEPVGIPTGFEDLDQLLGGMQRSDLIIIAARPGVGKTSLMLSIARNAAKLGNNAKVAIFSLEMSGEQLVQRLVSAETGINSQKLRTGDLTDGEWNLFTRAAGNLGALNIFIDDTPALTPLQMRTKCRRLQREHGLDLVVVDYLQLMNSGLPRNDNRVQEISYISRNLKELAREMNVPLLSAAQLSRQVEQRGDKRPQLSDLRESGCLAGETLIYLPDKGHYVEIRSLVDQSGFRVLSMNPDTLKLEPAVVSHAFCTGTKPVFKLKTQLGRTIRATANHKFYTLDGWKRLDELTGEVAYPIEGETYWDSIASIEPDGETDVYDLTVPGLSNFTANNIIVHNSIEQDADIVMFIYREDMYEENSERQNQADLLISKHRNGPTGVVTLYFNKSNTQFTDMQRHKVSLADY